MSGHHSFNEIKRKALEGKAEPTEYRTKSGRILRDADLERLADEAEQGYDVDLIKARLKDPAELQAQLAKEEADRYHRPWWKLVRAWDRLRGR